MVRGVVIRSAILGAVVVRKVLPKRIYYSIKDFASSRGMLDGMRGYQALARAGGPAQALARPDKGDARASSPSETPYAIVTNRAFTSESYFSRRNILLQERVEQVRAGILIEEALSGFNALHFDERLVIYPYFAAWLIAQKPDQMLLDIGAGVAHKTLHNLLQTQLHSVWSYNMDREASIRVKQKEGFHGSARTQRFPVGMKYSLVTCLLRAPRPKYDLDLCGTETFEKEIVPKAKHLRGVFKKIVALTKEKGHFLIALPHQLEQQVRLEGCLAILRAEGVQTSCQTFMPTPNGWMPGDPGSRESVNSGTLASVTFIAGNRRTWGL